MIANVKEIIVRNIHVYNAVKIEFHNDGKKYNCFEPNGIETHNGFVHPFNISRILGILFNCNQIENHNTIIQANEIRGTISSLLDKDEQGNEKRIELYLVRDKPEVSKYVLVIGDRRGEIPLTEPKETIKEYISQFINLKFNEKDKV